MATSFTNTVTLITIMEIVLLSIVFFLCFNGIDELIEFLITDNTQIIQDDTLTLENDWNSKSFIEVYNSLRSDIQDGITIIDGGKFFDFDEDITI